MGFTTKQNVIEVSDVEEAKEYLKEALDAAKHFEPAYDRVLIRRSVSALERRTQKSGLLLTDQTKDSTQSAEGYIVGFGPTANDEAKKLYGKKILFSKYTGDDIYIPLPDGSKMQFILATDKDIYGELK